MISCVLGDFFPTSKNAFILGLIIRIIASYQMEMKTSSHFMCYVQHTAGADTIFIM